MRTARDLDRQCEYICNDNDMWPFAPGGPSLKIAVEYGSLDISSIMSSFLGIQRLFIGNAINYASRISSASKGNRCLVGPAAAERILLEGYSLDGPYLVKGKAREKHYTYYHFDLGDLWIEGERKIGKDTYWG
jgi:class 3 adenylate cyclase